MDRPQTERGSVEIACDLFAALAVADWPKREWTVLAEILLQVYGPQERREAHIDPRTVEHYSDLSAKNVYRALKNLKACGVISETKTGGYRFVKDFESWDYEAVEKVTGNPFKTRRLTPGDVRFALSANERFASRLPINRSKADGIQPDTNGIQPDTVSDHQRYPTGYHSGAETVSNGIPAIIGTRARELVDDEGSKSISNIADAGKVTVKALVDEAKALHGESVAREVAYYASEILGTFGDDLHFYRAAIREAKRSGAEIKKPHRWFLKVARGYRDIGNGLPPEPSSIAPQPSGKPADRSTPPPLPGVAESKGCERCEGTGLASVYHPDPKAARQPPTTGADCTCPLGRSMRATRKGDDLRRIPDLADVLAGKSAWRLERPEESP